MRADSKQLNKRVVESLAKAGAFDCLFHGEGPAQRTRAMETVEVFISDCDPHHARDINQDMLFATAGQADLAAAKGKGPQIMSEHAILKNEREVLGFYFSGHPLNSYRRHIGMLSNSTVEKVLNGGFEEGAMVRLAGIVSQFKAMQTKKGDPMAKLEIEDLSGNIWVCLFPKTYAAFGSQMGPNKMVVISGKVQKTEFGENSFELIANEAVGLYEAMNKWGKNLLVDLPEGILFDEKQLSELKGVLSHSHGYTPVYLRVNTKTKNSYVIETGLGVVFCEALFRDIEKLLGDKTWQVESGF